MDRRTPADIEQELVRVLRRRVAVTYAGYGIGLACIVSCALLPVPILGALATDIAIGVLGLLIYTACTGAWMGREVGNASVFLAGFAGVLYAESALAVAILTGAARPAFLAFRDGMPGHDLLVRYGLFPIILIGIFGGPLAAVLGLLYARTARQCGCLAACSSLASKLQRQSESQYR